MAFTSKNYVASGTTFRVLYNSDIKEIWFQSLPGYTVLGTISTAGLYLQAHEVGYETMDQFIIKLKSWLNSLLAIFFAPATPEPEPDPVTTPEVDSMDVQINELIASLTISSGKFV